MKTITTLFVSAALLFLCSCKKPALDDVVSAKKKGYFFNTWIIDDDNNSNHNSTQNSHTFHDKHDPHITIRTNYSYTLHYTDASNTNINEAGTCEVNDQDKTITFSPQGGAPYTFTIVAISEEVFTLKASFTQTTTTTTNEGVVVPVTNTTTETLYLEDND